MRTFRRWPTKLGPKGPAEIQALLESDPDYFNDLSCDNDVEAMTTVMLVADEMFPLGRRRSDEVDGASGSYSEIRGIHELRWASGAKKHFTKEFNDSVDCIRADNRRGVQNAGLMNKDKTRAVQFIPPFDVFEKVVAYLLMFAGATSDAARKLLGEEMVLKTAAIGTKEVLASLSASDVPPGASQQSIDGAVALAQWFKTSFDMTAQADKEVTAFRAKRMGMVEPLPTVTLEALFDLFGRSSPQEVHPHALLTSLVADPKYLTAYATDPYNSESEVNTRLFELLLLVFMGFIVIVEKRWGLVHYADDDENFARAANRLCEWCDEASMDGLRSLVPKAGASTCALKQDKADMVSRSFKALMLGEAVAVEAIESPFATADIAVWAPRSPVEPCAQDEPATRPQDVFTQSGGGLDGGGSSPNKKLKAEMPLCEVDFHAHRNLYSELTKFYFKSKTAHVECRRITQKVKSAGSVANAPDVAKTVQRVWLELGLGKDVGKTLYVQTLLVSPPEDKMATAIEKLGELFEWSVDVREEVKMKWATRTVNQEFDLAAMDRLVSKLGKAGSAAQPSTGDGAELASGNVAPPTQQHLEEDIPPTAVV